MNDLYYQRTAAEWNANAARQQYERAVKAEQERDALLAALVAANERISELEAVLRAIRGRMWIE